MTVSGARVWARMDRSPLCSMVKKRNDDLPPPRGGRSVSMPIERKPIHDHMNRTMRYRSGSRKYVSYAARSTSRKSLTFGTTGASESFCTIA